MTNREFLIMWVGTPVAFFIFIKIIFWFKAKNCKHWTNPTSRALTNNYNAFHNDQMKLVCDDCGARYVQSP